MEALVNLFFKALRLYRRKYQISFQLYTLPAWVPSECAEITFYNAGTSVAMIQNLPLLPSVQLSIGGNSNEIDVTAYNISFQPGGNNALYVIVKNYV
jgi:hypothetical protein